MKSKIWILIWLTLTGTIVSAQTKSVNVTIAGSLSTLITANEQSSINILSVSGNIDARDFAFIRDKIKNLTNLNLSSASIRAYTGTSGTFADTLITYPANEIPQFALYNPWLLTYKSTLTTISFPASLTSIGKMALYYCWNLTSLSIPAAVTKIDDYAIYGCYALTTISVPTQNTRFTSSSGILYNKSQDTLFIVPNAKSGNISIPSTVKHIANSAFENCYNLSSVTFSSSVTSIGKYAFSYCSGISGNLTLPSNLKKIDNGAFYGCSNLNGTVSIPASLTEIGYYCFYLSNNIQSFSVNNANPDYASVNDILYSKNLDTLFICPPGKKGTITIPASVKLIGSHSFYNCSGITGTLNIPALVDFIGYYTFYGCTGINNFNVDNQNTYFCTVNGVLYSKNTDRLIDCPASYSGEFSIPETVKSIDPGAFNNCSKITGNLHISASVESIGIYSFYNCSSLNGFSVDENNKFYSSDEGLLFSKNLDTLLVCPLSKTGSITLPTQTRHIGSEAFEGCNKLTTIFLPAGLQSVGYYAFSSCTGLTKLFLPPVAIIYAGAFNACSGLQELGIDKSNPPVVDYYTFESVNKQSCILDVPLGYSTIYKESPYWSDFTQIVEKNMNTGLSEDVKHNYKIYKSQHYLTIDGLKPGQTIKIYTLHGRIITKLTTNCSTATINLIAKGIFIVDIEGFTEKVIF